MMDQLNEVLFEIVSGVIEFFLIRIDSLNILRGLRLAPHYKFITTLTCIVVVAFISEAFIVGPLKTRLRSLPNLLYLRRIISIVFAVFLTKSLLKDALTVQREGGETIQILQTNFGFVILTAFLLFLEIRLSSNH